VTRDSLSSNASHLCTVFKYILPSVSSYCLFGMKVMTVCVVQALWW